MDPRLDNFVDYTFYSFSSSLYCYSFMYLSLYDNTFDLEDLNPSLWFGLVDTLHCVWITQ